MKKITINSNVFEKNNIQAGKNRNLLQQNKIYTINLVGSPGAGKTTILEQLIARLKGKINLAIIEGDLFTDRDARRIKAHGVQVIQINTGGICHLEAGMVAEALNKLNLNEIDLLIIENVGNLVCTAGFDLGEDIMVTVLSTPEGSDKPLKYPNIFEKSAMVIINKIDLLNLSDFNLDEVSVYLNKTNQELTILQTSCQSGEGLDRLSNYFLNLIRERKINK